MFYYGGGGGGGGESMVSFYLGLVTGKHLMFYLKVWSPVTF